MEQKKINWFILSLIFSFGWAIIYFDRTMLTPIINVLLNDLNVDSNKIGIIFSTFFLGYTMLQIPGGLLGEKFGIMNIIKLSFLILALISIISSLKMSFILFMLLRTFSGAAEGLYYGPQFAYSSKIIDSKYKVFATTIINSGMSLGIILGTYFPTYLVIKKNYSYKFLFYMLFLLSLLFVFLVKTYVPDIKQEKKIEKFIMNKELAKIFFISFCSLYGFFHILTWLSIYLSSEKNLDPVKVALYIAIIPVISIFSSLTFSKLIDKFRKIKLFTIILLVFTAISIFLMANYSSPKILMISVIIYGIFGKLALDPILIVATSHASENDNLSTVLAIFNFVGLLSSVIAPYVGGKILEFTNSLSLSFNISFVLIFIALILSFKMRDI